LFSSNSMPIRYLDSWSGTAPKPIRILANRGVSGIDGNISTLLGAGAGSCSQIFGLLGDLACYHDMNGLLAAMDMDAVIVVLNNGGGGIFGYLPQAGLEQFEEHWLTPTNLDFRTVAELYSLNFHRVNSQTGFQPALACAIDEPGFSMIEVMIDRERSLARHLEWLETTTHV
ncbi:MAG: 2-succinyl-5-enolpyruvyl-6-hydroxy-3-cyclohexene-1-carboxylate synthase, partial [Gammaproteobacteria bacterium]|nr:2-succinyl-5-enolpyruvyl-6-hydroxy-3-cyclohexene-1-carboxylate synthase [Gammaproteobacteria bacterium]